MTPDQQRLRDINAALIPLVVASSTDRVTPAQLSRTAADMEHRLTQLPDSTRKSLRPRLGRVMAYAAATLGDTATVRHWAGSTPTRFNGAAAWAAAAAGDRATAERLLAAGDTVRSPPNEFALARAAEMLGNTREALRHSERLDTLDSSGLGNADTDWLLLVRSYPGRAAMYRELGDTARAREYYERFVHLWRDADDELRPDVDKALRALGQPPRREGN
jgi:tetratricopeptide (TPR) repeat protein